MYCIKSQTAVIFATRYPEKYDSQLASWISIGASPRGSISLDKASRVYAWMQGRNYVTPDDVQAIIKDVLRHRIALSYEAEADRISSDRVIEEMIKFSRSQSQLETSDRHQNS